MPQELDSLTTAHLAWMRDNNDLSPATIRARQSVFRSLPNAGTASREEVEQWWADRATLSRSARTANLSHLRRFYLWCQRWEHRADDPTLRLDAPRRQQGVPRPFGRQEIRTVMDAVTPDLRRAVALGALAGLRVSESAALDWSDVDLDTRRMRIERSKGGKTRVVAVNAQLLLELPPDVGGNVVTGGGQPYSADTLQRKLNRAITAAGVKGTSHRLRHYWATAALAGSGDLMTVSRALGHSSPSVTAVYTALSDDALDTVAAGVTV